MNDTITTGKRHPGPPLAVPAILFAGFFLAAILTGPILGTGTMPSPFSGRSEILDYLTGSTDASQIGGMLLIYSSLGLTLFGAITQSRLTFLAPNVPGPAIAGAGAFFAAGLLAISGVTQWMLSRADVLSDPALAHALQYVSFVTGGPAHTVALTPLVLGLAVTSWFVRRTPRGLSIAGFAIAALCLCSGIALAAPALTPLVAIARFTAIIWFVTMAVALPRTRGPRRRAARVATAPAAEAVAV